MSNHTLALWLYKHVEWLFWPVLAAAVVTMLLPGNSLSAISSVLLAITFLVFSGAMVLQAALGLGPKISIVLALVGFAGSIFTLINKPSGGLLIVIVVLALLVAVAGRRRVSRNGSSEKI